MATQFTDSSWEQDVLKSDKPVLVDFWAEWCGPCRMIGPLVEELANEYGLWIIEDACHAPGGSFIKSNGQESKCGSGEFANLAIFSFHPVKHIASGEGGMITTNDEALYNRLLALRTHGIVKNDNLYTNGVDFASGVENAESYPMWYMEMQVLGFRFGKLAYITDAKTISVLEKSKLQDLDILIINALHQYPHPSHFNLAEALDFINEIKPKQSFLTHISHLFGLHEQINETLPENVQLAYDGLVLSFNYSA